MKAIYRLKPHEQVVVIGSKVFIEQKFNIKDWARDIINEYGHDYDAVYSKIGITAARNAYTDSRGVAWCNPKDTFDESIGFAIAICRAEGIEIPDEVFC